MIATGAGLAEGGIIAAATTTAAAVVSGIGIVVGGAAAYLHYSSLKDDLTKLEDDQAKREMSIKEMAEQAAELQEALLKLSSEKNSIVRGLQPANYSARHIHTLTIVRSPRPGSSRLSRTLCATCPSYRVASRASWSS